MNKLTAFAFTMALSLGGASTAFASSMNDQAPRVQDLSAQEMSSVVGASGGRIYWRTHVGPTDLRQWDPGYHRKIVRPGQHEIGRHFIRAGTRVQVWCRGNHGVRSGQFRMPRYSIGLHC